MYSYNYKLQWQPGCFHVNWSQANQQMGNIFGKFECNCFTTRINVLLWTKTHSMKVSSSFLQWTNLTIYLHNCKLTWTSLWQRTSISRSESSTTSHGRYVLNSIEWLIIKFWNVLEYFFRIGEFFDHISSKVNLNNPPLMLTLEGIVIFLGILKNINFLYKKRSW